MELNRILVGVDGSEAASTALRWAATAVADEGEVIAVHATGTALITQAAVSASTGLGMFRDSSTAKEEAHRSLHAWCEPLRAAEVAHREIVADDDPREALLHHALREDVDVIAIGHDDSIGLVDRLFPDLVDKLLERARRPVVIVPGAT